MSFAPGELVCGDLTVEGEAPAGIGNPLLGPVLTARDPENRESWVVTLGPNLVPTEREEGQLLVAADHLRRIRHATLAPVAGAQTSDAGVSVAFAAPPGAVSLRASAGWLAPEQLFQVGLEIARGLAVLHGHGALHGALSPDTVVVAQGIHVLWQFGLAAHCDPDGFMLRARRVLGSATPPELLQGMAHSPATDIYAWGLTLAEMATGKRGAEAAAPALDGDVPDLEFGLDDLVARALSPDPLDRPTSGDALLDLFEALGATTPEESGPVRVPPLLMTELPSKGGATQFAPGGPAAPPRPAPPRPAPKVIAVPPSGPARVPAQPVPLPTPPPGFNPPGLGPDPSAMGARGLADEDMVSLDDPRDPSASGSMEEVSLEDVEGASASASMEMLSEGVVELDASDSARGSITMMADPAAVVPPPAPAARPSKPPPARPPGAGTARTEFAAGAGAAPTQLATADVGTAPTIGVGSAAPPAAAERSGEEDLDEAIALASSPNDEALTVDASAMPASGTQVPGQSPFAGRPAPRPAAGPDQRVVADYRPPRPAGPHGPTPGRMALALITFSAALVAFPASVVIQARGGLDGLLGPAPLPAGLAAAGSTASDDVEPTAVAASQRAALDARLAEVEAFKAAERRAAQGPDPIESDSGEPTSSGGSESGTGEDAADTPDAPKGPRTCPDDTTALGRSACIERWEFPGRRRLPETAVTMRTAARICEERGRRLCTLREWTRACTAGRGQAFPYGQIYAPDVCNTASIAGFPQELALSGAYERCVSPLGVYDLTGNVGEWVANGLAVGGDTSTPGPEASCQAQGRPPPGHADDRLGFRCCVDLAPEKTR